MDSQTLLAQLRDIRLPTPPPPEPVWDLWLAALCLLAAFVVTVISMRRRAPTWQQEALSGLQRVSRITDTSALPALARVVRQLAIHLGTPEVRHQSGIPYLQTLDQIFDTQFFTNGPGKVLGNALYQQPVAHQDLVEQIEGIRQLVIQRATRKD